MNWNETILSKRPAEEIWTQIFQELQRLATTTTSPVELNQALSPWDRLLAESAWELWAAYPAFPGRTSVQLKDWWTRSAAGGRAVLILDALSLRDLPALLGGAQTRHIQPTVVAVTGAEVPTDTTPFAKALGASSRSSLQHNGATASFALQSTNLQTDVFNAPFRDCPVPNARDLFLWHEWQDPQVHNNLLHDAVHRTASQQLQSDDFWDFVNRLRQGRKLVITSDHGYAVSAHFSTTLDDEQVVSTLKDVFGASRLCPAPAAWPHSFLPPLVQHTNGHYVVVGQVKWRVQGGFPPRCHGGLSLLEVAVPWVELPPI
ncbi:conserved hypothetical protein [Verrucomicrobia bacterium]|nr:conserved hypothetical protein [Verrucomicrobiota bacterium]